MDLIYDGLDAHSLEAGGAAWESVSILARDDKGALQGGLIASQAGRSMLVFMLWVDASARKSGLGRALMQKIEQDAIARRCERVMVDTFSYQAPYFYKKLGLRS